MFDWIFGTSKGQKKQQIASEDKLQKQDGWVYDFIRQYLVSPIWKNPLLDFIEQNCTVFEDSEENKFQYTKIFQQFTSLCSILIQTIVEQTGITFRTLQKCIIMGLKSKDDQKIFTQILICDNFQTFKRIMISKNRELQTEALRTIRQTNKQQDLVQDKIDFKEKQRLQLEQAIALSLALQQKVKQQEQAELQQAIRISQTYTQSQQSKPQKNKKSLLGELPPLMINPMKKFESPTEFQSEKERINKQITELKANHQPQEDSQQRKKRLLQQRQLLRKRKQQQRQLELKKFVQNKQTSNIPDSKITEEDLMRRKKLMNRLKEQLNSD